MSIWDTRTPMMMLFALVILALAAATSATTEDGVLVNQVEATNNQHPPLKYISYSQYLPYQAAHPPLVYHLPGMPLPLSYQIPVQQVPSGATPPARTPASTVLIQRLMHAPASFPVAALPHYATINNGLQFTTTAGAESRGNCLDLISKCLNVPIRYQSIMMETAAGQPFTYARNPVLQPILLEEDVDSQTTYGPILYCFMFVLKHSSDVACLAQLPGAVLPTLCAILNIPGIAFC